MRSTSSPDWNSVRSAAPTATTSDATQHKMSAIVAETAGTASVAPDRNRKRVRRDVGDREREKSDPSRVRCTVTWVENLLTEVYLGLDVLTS